MDLQRLRAETRVEHEATEAAMPLLAPSLDLGTYVSVLRLLLPVLRGWEQWAQGAGPESWRPLLASRRRSHLIEADLQVLGAPKVPGEKLTGVDWGSVVGASGVPNSPEALEAGSAGALYVVEGSTLGGRFLARHVQSALSLEPGRGDAYFQGHGEGTGALWRETMAVIAAVPEVHSELVIAAAKRTFGAFRSALGQPASTSLTSHASG